MPAPPPHAHHLGSLLNVRCGKVCHYVSVLHALVTTHIISFLFIFSQFYESEKPGKIFKLRSKKLYKVLSTNSVAEAEMADFGKPPFLFPDNPNKTKVRKDLLFALKRYRHCLSQEATLPGLGGGRGHLSLTVFSRWTLSSTSRDKATHF